MKLPKGTYVRSMPLGFVGDAISLSGLTGTKLKCDVVGLYYPFWWRITSGGARANYRYPTAIVELNAATGEVHMRDTDEIVLGSAGHALNLKVKENPKTENLKVILIEEHSGCYIHLKNVIERRWPSVSIDQAEGPTFRNSSKIYLLNKNLDEALDIADRLYLGNALYFFDPLRSVSYASIEKVARRRMDDFFKKGTEFVIFVFTSDWFLGRDDFAALPSTLERNTWSNEEANTVEEADKLFGTSEWRSRLLNSQPIETKERTFVQLYINRLHKWFRYVLPMPFNPKENQIFHLVLCSNYETGVRATRDFYCSKTKNPKYSPANSSAFKRFQELHAELFERLERNRRPLHWLFLWKIIRDHEEGICDCKCPDLIKLESDEERRQCLFDWLEEQSYLNQFHIENAWNLNIKQYRLNWSMIEEQLGVSPPPILVPLSTEDVKQS